MQPGNSFGPSIQVRKLPFVSLPPTGIEWDDFEIVGNQDGLGFHFSLPVSSRSAFRYCLTFALDWLIAVAGCGQ